MKTSSKIILIILAFLVVITTGALIFIKIFKTKSLPDYNSEITIPGMTDEVIVYRDEFAVPHIYAKNEIDLYRAVGYVTAQDRLWQMDLIRRVTQGRLSEIFGEDFVETDLLLRALRIPEKSKIIIDSLDENFKNLLQAYADGINYYIENEELPIEFKLIGYEPEKWIPEHSANIIGYIGWDLGTAWRNEIVANEIRKIVDDEKFKAVAPDFKESKYIYDFQLDSINYEFKNNLLSSVDLIKDLSFEPLMASNNWAVSGDKSSTGEPIMANDMHLGLSVPGIWYQIHQVVEGEFEVTGLLIPGEPSIIAGHNDNIAWGMTNVMLDDIDFYVETINPENKYQYKFNGEWKDFDVKKEIIKTKEGEEIEKELLFTHRGPVISEIKNIEDKSVSMRWIGNEYSNELLGTMLFNRAKNWDDFKEGLKLFISVSQNIVYADKEGNIALYCVAGIPIRKGDGITLYSGETDEYDWKGFVPFDSLPHEFNPERGYVSSANNRTADNYPYYISQWYYQDYRISRIREMLEEKDKISIEDIQKMHLDQKSKMVENFLPDIIYHASSINSDDVVVKKSLEILSKWDGMLTTESQAATIFEEFYITFAKNLITDELGENLSTEVLNASLLTNNLVQYVFDNQYSYWCDDISTTDKTEEFPDIVIASYLETIEKLKTEMGDNPEKWYWGNVHTLTLIHPLSKVKILDFVFNLNRGPYGVGGSNHTVCPFKYSFTTNFEAFHGASHRHIFSIENWDNSLTVIPTGISGQPASDFYCDQTELYIDGKYHCDNFSKEKVIENSLFKMTIN